MHELALSTTKTLMGDCVFNQKTHSVVFYAAYRNCNIITDKAGSMKEYVE